MQVVKPPHNKYLLRDLDEFTYKQYYRGYAKAKRAGFRTVVAFLSNKGIFMIAWEIGKGQIIYYGKRRLGYAILGGLSWVAAPLKNPTFKPFLERNFLIAVNRLLPCRLFVFNFDSI